MANAPGPNESALAAAIQRVTADTRGLVQDQVDLAKVELQQKAAVFGRGTVIAVAAGVFLVGALLLIIEGASWLAWYLLFPGQTFFWGFFLVAFLLIVCAVIAAAIAATRQTQETISEEARLTSEQVREAVVLPEEDRS
jgi:uncharacterized membrane protein YqjE